MSPLESLTPIYTAELFAPLDAELIALLRRLGPDDWMRQTVAPQWRVRHVAAHLVDGAIRRLTVGRDGYQLTTGQVNGYRDVLALIQRLNESGVEYGERLSPKLLVDLLEVTGRWLSEYFERLDPHGEATFSVDWAGESRSEHWMDVGRDYTERWHHQMQIRDAVAAVPLFERRWLFPLLDLSMRALPRAYSQTTARVGASVVIEVDGVEPMAWSLVREGVTWVLWRGSASTPDAEVRLDPDTAWKLLYNALKHAGSHAGATVSGNRSLAEPFFAARSVMV